MRPHRIVSHTRKRIVTGVMTCAIAVLALLLPSPALSTAPEKQEQLKHIAKQFRAKVGQSLKSADNALENTAALADKKAMRSYDALADGELLLLALTLQEASSPYDTMYAVEEPITAIKQGYHAYISLTDFSYIAGFEIKVDAESQRAYGWYMQQDRTFNLDLSTHTVRLGDTEQTVPADGVIVEGDDFYIQDTVMEQWFNFKTTIQPQGQRINITTGEQLPLQGRLNRMKRRKGNYVRTQPEQPRLERDYQVVTVPRADVQLLQRLERRGDGTEANNYSNYSVIASNQLLDHEMTSFVSGTLASTRDSRPLDQARINFRKESENNDLLGPLAAKTYEFNDLTPVVISGTGSAGAERGGRISNRSNRYSVDTSTLIDGNAQPGWDIELYRNESFIAGTTADDSGRYSFENVQLFAGDNKFRILLFGPQGERSEDERIVTVLPGLIGDIKGYYDLSLTQKGTITYRAEEQEDNEDRGTLRFVGSYDRRVNDNLTLRGGLHTRETNGQRDNYYYSGAVTGFGLAIINADLITTSDGPFKSTLLARRNFGRHGASAGLEYISADFSEDYIDDTTDVRQRESVYGNLNGPFMSDVFSRVSYDLGSRLTRYEDGNLLTYNTLGLYSVYKRLRFRNELEVSIDQSSQEEPLEVHYTTGVTGRHAGYYWRGTLDFEVTPESTPEEFRLDVDKSYNSSLSAFGSARHLFGDTLSEISGGVTYYTDYARISPSLSYDTDQNAQAKLQVNFSLAQDPVDNSVVMSSRPLSGQGSLTTFAYLDKDGNGLYDGTDEPLPDVVITAKQYGIELVTDENGEAYSAKIPTNRVSDVVMEENSAFDPTWISGYSGASILLRPTESARIEFPVLRGAEIDGTTSYIDADGTSYPTKSMILKMTTPDGVVTQSAASSFDGFYILSRIRPGVYYYSTDSSQSPTTAYRIPEKIVITPEGAQMYGKNITLTRGYDIPFTFSASNTNPALERRTKILKPEDIAREDVYIRLGNYRSSLAASLAWYKLKLQTRSWHNQLTPMANNFDTVARDEKTGRLPLLLKPAQALRIEEAALLCERLVDAGFGECGVDVVTTYQDGSNAASAAPAPSKG